MPWPSLEWPRLGLVAGLFSSPVSGRRERKSLARFFIRSEGRTFTLENSKNQVQRFFFVGDDERKMNVSRSSSCKDRTRGSSLLLGSLASSGRGGTYVTTEYGYHWTSANSTQNFKDGGPPNARDIQRLPFSVIRLYLRISPALDQA